MASRDELDELNFTPEPPQHPDVRRDIRIRYRSLLNDVSTNRSELVAGNTLVLKEKIDSTNAIFENVKHPREAALDAQCCSSIAILGKQKAQALSTDFSNFSCVEFAEKLITRLGRDLTTDSGDGSSPPGIDRDGWIRLGEASQTFLRRCPPLHYMYGTLKREVPLPKTRPDRDDEKNQQKEAIAPKEVKKFGIDEKEEATTKEVENVLKILRAVYKSNDNTPICYFEFVTNPTSFSQTIENIFYTSFLVADGYARMFLDEDDLPVIEPVEGATGRSEEVDVLEDDGEIHQMVMSWSMQDWREVVNSFEITRPLIPTRASQKPTAPTTSKGSGKGSVNKAVRPGPSSRRDDIESSDDEPSTSQQKRRS